MSVRCVSILSIPSLTLQGFMYQWLYKIVNMSIYTEYNNTKKQREYGIVLTADKYRLMLMEQWFGVSICTLTILLTTDKKRARSLT